MQVDSHSKRERLDSKFEFRVECFEFWVANFEFRVESSRLSFERKQKACRSINYLGVAAKYRNAVSSYDLQSGSNARA